MLIRSIYRDFVDDDIFNDFDILFDNEFFIITAIQETREGNTEDF